VNEPARIGQRDDDLIRCLNKVVEGDLTARPAGDDPLSEAVERLISRCAQDVTSSLDNAVAQSVGANETAISSGHMLSAARDVDAQAQSMAAAVEELVAGIREIGHSSANALGYVEGVEKATAEGARASSEAIAATEAIDVAVTEATQKAGGLAEASRQIGEIVTSIEKIAAQTNLLALNATIEAARAGDAGKGFAVVASEVKGLSKQTADATNDIRDRIEALRTEMSSIVESMDKGARAVEAGRRVIESVGDGMREINQQVDKVKDGMSEIDSVLSQQSEASGEVASGVSSVAQMTKSTVEQIEKAADAMDSTVQRIGEQLAELSTYELPGKIIRLAKADHVIWKKRLADMLVGRCHLAESELSDHHSCRLGTWYYGSSAADYRENRAFRSLEEPHVRVHRHGIEATRRYNAGDLSGALSEIAEVEDASKDVLRLLEELQEASTG